MRLSPALLCFFVIFSAAAAAPPPSPTDTYISARDRYVAAFKAHATQGKADKRHSRAMADLERRLKRIIPPWHAPGFPPEGQINLGSLEEGYVDTGMLDGLRYMAKDATVIVTTQPLLRRWLDGLGKWWPGNAKAPPQVESAFRTEEFYLQVFAFDAAAYFYGDMPVALAGRKSSAMVELAFFTNGENLGESPTDLVAAVVRGDRVFFAAQKLKVAAVAVPVCKTALKQVLAKSDQVLEDRADREYRACFAQHLREQPNYAAINKQAQALVDLLH